jgi:3-oxoadipate enol-lactonase
MNSKEAFVVQPAHQQTQQEWQQVQDVAGITYLSAGEGRPILFLHGVGGAARQFGPQLAQFGRSWQAIAWDMPGYSGSAPLPLVTIDALAAALGGFIAALGLERPVLVGHSLGGMVVQRLLVEAPHAASAVVLAQTSAAFGGHDPAWSEAFLRQQLGPLDEGRSMAELAPSLVAAMVGEAPDPTGIALAEDCLAETPDATYRDSIQALPGFDLREALPRIAVPTLVLAGSRDPNAPAAGMERMAALIPGARFVVLEGAGHLAHLEQPARFNAAVEAFLHIL